MSQTDLSLSALSAALHAGEVSSKELTTDALNKAKANAHLNAFINLTEEQALQQAEAADKRLQSGNAHVLTGIPMAHKDLFCSEGTKTTCGSRMLENFVAPYDANVVSKLKQVDMVCIGKTNMDEFAMGSTNESSYFGAVKNPWNTDCVPGGSSGGSAAAVAAGIVPMATGSDTGGSVRQPAALCGLTGIKPTYGRISRWGMVAFASSFDQAGVFANSAQDAAIVLQQLCGFDAKDSTSLQQDVDDFAAALNLPLAGKKIGLPKEFFNEQLDNQVSDAVHAAAKTFESLGATLVDISLEKSKLAIPCYYVLAPAEASSNLSRFDGVRYGHRSSEYNNLTEMYENTRAEGFGDEVKRRIMVGTYALSSGYYDAYYIKAQKLRRMIADDFRNAFKQCDFILGPTTPNTAAKIGELNDDPATMYLEDIYTVSANLAGIPGISIPAGLDDKGLPIGVQLMGDYCQEAGLLNAAHQFQSHTDWHTQRAEATQ